VERVGNSPKEVMSGYSHQGVATLTYKFATCNRHHAYNAS
jgi:hypothetical protein